MSTQDQIIAILADQALLQPSDVALDNSLEDLGIDSMALVESIFAIEEAFDISIPFATAKATLIVEKLPGPLLTIIEKL